MCRQLDTEIKQLRRDKWSTSPEPDYLTFTGWVCWWRGGRQPPPYEFVANGTATKPALDVSPNRGGANSTAAVTLETPLLKKSGTLARTISDRIWTHLI